MDYDGQVVTSSNNNPITIELTSSNLVYPPRYDAGKSLWSEAGVFIFTNITFIGEPGTTVNFVIQSSYINTEL